jgi:hypothetical protein
MRASMASPISRPVSRRSQSADAAAPLTGRANYQVTASSRRTSSGTVPSLKVIRLSDERVIYPFQGHADMPFFEDAEAAQLFAETYGWQLVDGDIAVPE